MKASLLYQLTDIIRVHLFSQSFYSFASKIKICFKDFVGHKITKATIVHSQKQANLAWVRYRRYCTLLTVLLLAPTT